MDSTLVLQCLQGNRPAALTTLQSFLQHYADWMIMVWWCVWIAVAFYLIWQLKIAFQNRSVR